MTPKSASIIATEKSIPKVIKSAASMETPNSPLTNATNLYPRYIIRPMKSNESTTAITVLSVT